MKNSVDTNFVKSFFFIKVTVNGDYKTAICEMHQTKLLVSLKVIKGENYVVLMLKPRCNADSVVLINHVIQAPRLLT